ncbi:MAG: hypothetical protein Q7U60_00685, partial [Candidatus Methanoperedens sp.]|nr:hypothetical protein [Candidatus Methanoperedens sp.]
FNYASTYPRRKIEIDAPQPKPAYTKNFINTPHDPNSLIVPQVLSLFGKKNEPIKESVSPLVTEASTGGKIVTATQTIPPKETPQPEKKEEKKSIVAGILDFFKGIFGW